MLFSRKIFHEPKIPTDTQLLLNCNKIPEGKQIKVLQLFKSQLFCPIGFKKEELDHCRDIIAYKFL